jgi:hypothetical protein
LARREDEPDVRVRTALLVLVVSLLLAVIGLLGCGTTENEGEKVSTRPPATVPVRSATPSVAPISGEPANFMAVDADPESEEVDSSATRPLGVPFDVTVDVSSVTESYHVYQFKLAWDSAILSFVSGDHLSPDGFSICFAFESSGSDVTAGCGRTGGGSTYIGPVDKVSFQCKAQGTSTLHFQSLGDDPVWGTTTFSPTTAGFIVTGTVDATVTCR